MTHPYRTAAHHKQHAYAEEVKTNVKKTLWREWIWYLIPQAVFAVVGGLLVDMCKWPVAGGAFIVIAGIAAIISGTKWMALDLTFASETMALLNRLAEEDDEKKAKEAAKESS